MARYAAYGSDGRALLLLSVDGPVVSSAMHFRVLEGYGWISSATVDIAADTHSLNLAGNEQPLKSQNLSHRTEDAFDKSLTLLPLHLFCQ
jgi:hypothetical protein